MSKAAYVKAQGQTRAHTCHWPGCDKQVPPAMWGCSVHWFRLPKALRDEVWRAYRPGQEKDMHPSSEYLEVAKRVEAWILTNSLDFRYRCGCGHEFDERMGKYGCANCEGDQGPAKLITP